MPRLSVSALKDMEPWRRSVAMAGMLYFAALAVITGLAALGVRVAALEVSERMLAFERFVIAHGLTRLYFSAALLASTVAFVVICARAYRVVDALKAGIMTLPACVALQYVPDFGTYAALQLALIMGTAWLLRPSGVTAFSAVLLYAVNLGLNAVQQYVKLPLYPLPGQMGVAQSLLLSLDMWVLYGIVIIADSRGKGVMGWVGALLAFLTTRIRALGRTRASTRTSKR